MRTLFLLAAVVTLLGCRPDKPGKPDVDRLESSDVAQSAWPDAIRLRNTDVHLYIVPSLGRVMNYGFLDGPNIIWTNPEMRPAQPGDWFDQTKNTPAKKTPTSNTSATKPAAWKNWGGDKVWPWPQDAWPVQIGRSWPPPPEVDQAPMQSRLTGTLGVRLESPAVRGYGVKLVREIALEPTGTRATLISRFEPAGGGVPPTQLAAWQITQLPVGTVYAKLAPGGKIKPLPPAPFESTKEIAPGVVIVNPPGDGKQGKTGLDAEALACAIGEYLFVARSSTAVEEANSFDAGERAQVFFQARPSAAKQDADSKAPPAQSMAYLEFEFTSPKKNVGRGQTPELKLTWELHRREGKAWKDAEVVKVLGGG